MVAIPRLALALACVVLAACAPAATSGPTGGASAPAAAPPAPSGQTTSAGSAAAAPPAPQKVNVAIVSPSEVMAIPWVAKDSGIFARYGFDAEVPLVTGTPRLVQSLIAGDFDYALVGTTALMRARIQGADPVILATTTNYTTQQLVADPRTDLHTLADLKGRTVGVTQYGSEGDTFLRILLARAGLAESDVSVLQMGGTPQVGAALATGNLEAGVLAGAPAFAIRQSGARLIASGTDLKVLAPSGTMATTRRYVERDRDSVARFMRAYVEAIHYFKTNREDAVRIMQEHMGGETDADIGMLYDSVRDLYQPLPIPSDEAIQAVLDRETDAQAKSLKPSDFVDVSFLRELEQSGFVDQLYR